MDMDDLVSEQGIEKVGVVYRPPRTTCLRFRRVRCMLWRPRASAPGSGPGCLPDG